MVFIKVLTANERADGFQYAEGYNALPAIGKGAYRGKRKKTYGLFFTTLDAIEDAVHGHTHYRAVIEYDVETFMCVAGRFKSIAVRLGPRVPFPPLNPRSFPGHAVLASNSVARSLLAVDASLLAHVADPTPVDQMRALVRYVGDYAYDLDGVGHAAEFDDDADGAAVAASRMVFHERDPQRYTLDRGQIECTALFRSVQPGVLDRFEVNEEVRRPPRPVMVKDTLTHRMPKIDVDLSHAAPAAPLSKASAAEIAKEIGETMFREYSTVDRCNLELRTLRMALNVTLPQMMYGVLTVITASPAVLKSNLVYCRNFISDTDRAETEMGLVKYIANKGMLTPAVADALVAEKIVTVLKRGKLKRFVTK